MAFEEDIRLKVSVEGLEKGVRKIEAAVDKLEKKNVGFTEAEKSAQRLLRTLEKIENAALSKLPTQVQVLIAYLKAANKGMAELSARTAVAISGFGQLGRVNFAPIIRQLQQTRDLLFEIQQVRIKFLDMPTGMRPRLSGNNPFQYLLDGLDLVRVRIIETQRLLEGFGTRGGRPALPPAGGFGGGGSRGGGGGGFSGGASSGGRRNQPLLPPDYQGLIDDAQTLRGLRNIRSALEDLRDTATIGSGAFRKYENQIAQVNNKIADAQLQGQRGGVGSTLSSANTIRGLRATRAALQDALEGAQLGSKSFKELAAALEKLDRQIEETTKTANKGGRSGAGGRRLGNVAAGVGFSALFGGGPGEIIGGGLGAAVGGLGGSLIGSVLGRAVDDFAQKTTELAAALQKPVDNFDKLVQSAIFASREEERRLALLIEFGYAVRANNEIQQRYIDLIGNQGLNDLNAVYEASDELSRAFARLNTAMQAVAAGPLKTLLDLLADYVNFNADAVETIAKRSNVFNNLNPSQQQEFRAKERAILDERIRQKITAEEYAKRNKELVQEFAKLLPSAIKPLSDKDKAEAAITRSNDRLSRTQKALSGEQIIEQYARAERERQRQQESYDRQRADILRSYEESLANLRESVERRITQMRLSAIAKENQILDQRAANELKALELRNSITQRLQREAAAQVGTDPRVSRDAQQLSQAFATFEQQSLSIEQKKAKLKRDTALEVLKLEIDAEVFKANIAKQVARLNINTAKQIENINRGIREKNADVNTRIFELQKSANAERLVGIAAEFRLLQIQLQLLNANQDYLDNLQQNILFFEAEAKRIRELEPPKPFREVAAVGGGGVDTSGLDTALQNRVTLERELLRLKLEGLDITKAENREAILNASSTIRVDAENTINGLLREQNEGLARQQRIQELVKSGLDEQQATAVQRVEQERDIALAKIDGANAALAAQIATTQDIDLQKRLRKEIEKNNEARGRIVEKSKEAVEKAKEVNKQEALLKSAVQRVAQGIEDGIVSAIDAAVDGTKSLGEALQEVASTLLKDIGRMLIRAGISGLGTQAGLPGFPGNYSGGPIASGSPSIVGERGPELFVPNVSGRVVNNEQFDAARQAMTTSSAVQSSTAALDREQEQIEMMNNPSPLDVRFETYSIGGMDVVTREEAMKISEQSAKKARAQVFADMRNKPATRAQLGIG